ncbi:MAG: NAD(P)/FAD-dependent oxidoreductase [bacterium]
MHQVVIVGGGFGGLAAATALGGADVNVILVDRRNFHLFQPLLYQVATGELSPGDIASPQREILRKRKNINVLQAEVTGLDVVNRQIQCGETTLPFDDLILSTGVRPHYFGNGQWEPLAPGLKTVEDALEIRKRIFRAFEKAEWEENPEAKRNWLTFVIVGGGATGVELAGAISELSRVTLREDFRRIDTGEAKIYLLEGSGRILSGFHASLSAKATSRLERMGVSVRTGTMVTSIEAGKVGIRDEGGDGQIDAKTVVWAAGVSASPLGAMLGEQTGVTLDRMGRVIVNPDLSIPGNPGIYVIGDLAHYPQAGGEPLPGLAPVATQQGRYAARHIMAKRKGKPIKEFRYLNKGNLAVIGRNSAVGELGKLRFSGFAAWLVWVFIHIRFLIEFDNKTKVMLQWFWSYIRRKRGARLITGPLTTEPLTTEPSPQEDSGKK